MIECVLWTGTKYANGYGQRGFRGKKTGAHRVAWMQLRGDIPIGLEIDHLCNVRACVNVEHMQLVTHAENMRLGRARRKRCKRGHAWPQSGSCRACLKRYQKGDAFKASQARWLERNREKRRAYHAEWHRKRREAAVER